MQRRGTAFEVARWVALGALLLIPLAPLVVVNDFYFPFITGKAFYLRILIELLVGAWVVLALLSKEYRPRLSILGIVAIAFVAWMALANSFAPNVTKAFWSNFERMEGWVLLIHLLGFLFAASAVLRAENKWRTWFYASLGGAALVSGYALLQLSGALPIHQGATRIDASFGNSAYLAVYLLFSACVAAWLSLTEPKREWRVLLGGFALLEFVLIFFTATRGTIIASILVVSMAALATIFFGSRRARSYAAIGLVALVLLGGVFYAARDSAFVRGNEILGRIASISPSVGETRFAIWGMALEGVAERPVFGWGQEGFNHVFNKFYEPSLYRQEPWFDRAHNTFIDWLSAGGVPAFLLYIGLFVSALYLLWRPSLGRGSTEASTPNVRSPEYSSTRGTANVSRTERIALSCALLGYAVHNLFVFDNLYSYIYFFAILAFIDSRVARPVPYLDRLPELSPADGTTYALPVAAVLTLATIFMVNSGGMRAAGSLIDALSFRGGSAGTLSAFEELVRHRGTGEQEIREQLVSFAAQAAGDANIPPEVKMGIATLAVGEMEQYVARYPFDARLRMQASYVYRLVGDLPAAYREVQAAIELSPRKPHFWADAGLLAWDGGDTEAARAAFMKAYELAPQFPELSVYAAMGALAAGDVPEAQRYLLGAYGTTTVDNDLLAFAYMRAKAWQPLFALLSARTDKEGAGPDTWFALASAHYAAGDTATAIRVLREAAVRFPEVGASVEAAIEEVRRQK